MTHFSMICSWIGDQLVRCFLLLSTSANVSWAMSGWLTRSNSVDMGRNDSEGEIGTRHYSAQHNHTSICSDTV